MQIHDQPAGVFIHHQDAVRQEHGFFDVVGSHEDGPGGDDAAGPQFQQFAPEGLGAEDVQGRKGLVQAQEFRLHRHGPGKSHLLEHAAGKFPGVGVLEAVQAYAVQQIQGPGGAQFGGHAPGLEGHFDVFLDRQPGKQGKGLEDDGGMGIHPVQRLAPVEHVPGGGGLQSGNDPQQGALAAAGGAHEGGELPVIQGQIDILNGGKDLFAAAVNLVDMPQFQERAVFVSHRSLHPIAFFGQAVQPLPEEPVNDYHGQDQGEGGGQ